MYDIHTPNLNPKQLLNLIFISKYYHYEERKNLTINLKTCKEKKIDLIFTFSSVKQLPPL